MAAGGDGGAGDLVLQSKPATPIPVNRLHTCIMVLIVRGLEGAVIKMKSLFVRVPWKSHAHNQCHNGSATKRFRPASITNGTITTVQHRLHAAERSISNGFESRR
jgi:hypothetical protein